jgi:uncharacterized membrane protein
MLLILLWVSVIYLIRILPDTIPVHFNFGGQPDNFGAKSTLILLPILASVLYVFLAFIKRMPAQLNYPVKQTPENKEKLHQLTIRLLSVLQVSIILLFGRIVLDVYLVSINKPISLYFGVMPFIGLFIVLPVVYYLIKVFGIK